MSASPAPLFTPSLAFRSCSVPLSLVCLSPHFVPSWPGDPSTISTWALSSLQLPPAARTPSGSWLMAFLLMLAQLMSISPAAKPASLGREATSAYCSPTDTDCNGPLMGPSRLSQVSVDRGFRI